MQINSSNYSRAVIRTELVVVSEAVFVALSPLVPFFIHRMKTFIPSLTLLVILVALYSTEANAQRERRAQSEGGGGMTGMVSALGITPECIAFVKQIFFDGAEFSMAKLTQIPSKLVTFAIQLMTPNPCTEIFSKTIAKLRDYGINLGGSS